MRERNNYSPELKARIVLELLREEKTVNQIVSETGVHATVLSRWKLEAVGRLHEIFEKGQSDTEKLKKEFEIKEGEYQKTIGELTMDLNFLKKKWNQFGGSMKEKK
jgi:transposase